MAKTNNVPRLAHKVETVAHMLSVHRATIWRMIAAKKLPTVKMGPNGGLTRIPDSAVQALLRGEISFAAEPVEVTPAMIEAGVAAYHEREDGLGIDEDDIAHIYRAMEAVRTKQGNPMTEEEILSRKPYTDAPPEPTLEDRASDLVNALMHQLRTDGNIRYVIDDLPMERKQMLHARLCMIATIALRGEPLVEVAVDSASQMPQMPPMQQMHQVQEMHQAPKAPNTGLGVPPLPAGGVVSVGISESDGFVVQPGGLLLSQQVKP